jgi:uncharacterized protein YlxW (UPF0749 family)
MSDEPREDAPLAKTSPEKTPPGKTPSEKMPSEKSRSEGPQPQAEPSAKAASEHRRTEHPGTEHPGTEHPGTEHPGTEGPAAEGPATGDLEAGDPASDSAASSATKASAAEPSAAEPSATEPSAAEPSATKPSADTGVDTAVDTGVDTAVDTVPVSTASGAAEAAAPRPASAAGSARRVTGAGIMIAVLLAVFGFVLVVQLRNVSADPTLAAARQEDLVRILSDLQAREQRLREDISQLESSQRQLTSGVEGGQAALEEATRRADELGILAGSLPAIGHGLHVTFKGNSDAVKATAVLDAVQELRGAGAEAMQISGPDGAEVRVVASTYFLDGKGGINVDGILLTGPYTIEVIGDPGTMRTALNIPGGVVELVGRDGGTVTMDEVAVVEVSARHGGSTLQYAQPVS